MPISVLWLHALSGLNSPNEQKVALLPTKVIGVFLRQCRLPSVLKHSFSSKCYLF